MASSERDPPAMPVRTYVVLLRQMNPQSIPFPLTPGAVRDIAEPHRIQVLDVMTCRGGFDAVLLCRAPDIPSLGSLLNALDGWHTDVLLATSHTRRGSHS
jgi:hypothetical protein